MARLGSRPIDELIRLAIIGDGTAFTELWDTNIDKLRVYIRSLIKSFDEYDVDDVCSNSFEKAFRQIGSYDPAKSQFPTWLKTIAHNTALDLVERKNRENKKYVSLDADAHLQPVIDTIGDGVDTPLESIIKNEDEEQTRKYIEGLPELYREVASKRLVDGLQYQEIAEELGMELNTVRTRIRRAKALIEKMKEDGD